MGEVAVPAERLWGVQTQRSLEFFDISTEKLPPELMAALMLIKRACAAVNLACGLLPSDKARAIKAAAEGARRAARRRISPERVANRLGHANPHERQ